MCRAFFPECELDIPGDGTVYATFGRLGFAEMYPSVPPNGVQSDPGQMLMLMHSGKMFCTDSHLLWSGYDEDKFSEVLRQFCHDPDTTAKFYIAKNRRSLLAAKKRREASYNK
jgi:hypothetical protein